jgi:hypothetical protein
MELNLGREGSRTLRSVLARLRGRAELDLDSCKRIGKSRQPLAKEHLLVPHLVGQ